ncbi:glycosyltransferase family protein [Couchioplanes caeruleus]|uniref:Uncharacterized protein n=1 Tax=Couchioplanes caeruleus subsp. caeruleus TaxID=56427 RepID=A0A1K0FHW9_9ACTN|nr:hypothetical protein [Couchioplanes caeruleus]OJF12336.1 hypothetical protein BG844_21190 [Couchioplanes caeruleus subsp. caeruleus]
MCGSRLDTVFEPDAVGRLVQPLRGRRVGAVSGDTKVANRGGLLGRWQHLEYVIGFNLDWCVRTCGLPPISSSWASLRNRH